VSVDGLPETLPFRQAQPRPATTVCRTPCGLPARVRDILPPTPPSTVHLPLDSRPAPCYDRSAMNRQHYAYFAFTTPARGLAEPTHA